MSRNSEAHSAYDNSSSSDTPTQQLSPAHYILLQKQQEHAGLEALREASAGMLERVEKLAAMSNIMADGGEAIGNVMRNWPHVFSILNLFDKPPSPPRSPNGTVLADEEPDEPIPELVRLPYNSQQEEK